MESKFKESIGIITQNIINELNKLISFNYLEHRDTFYLWFTTNCDYDFAYIYEMAFKRFLLEHFTIETERILSYYSQNAVYAICTYYEMYRDVTGLGHFINLFVTKQFECMDHCQLFLEN